MRAPHVKALVAAVLVASLPIGMGTLALVVFIERETGSYGAAGLVAAALAGGAAAVTPLLGRMIDRAGQAAVLLPCALVSPLALLLAAFEPGPAAVGAAGRARLTGPATPGASGGHEQLTDGPRRDARPYSFTHVMQT